MTGEVHESSVEVVHLTVNGLQSVLQFFWVPAFSNDSGDLLQK